MPLPLHELFPDEDYRFHLTLRKGNLGEFFGSADAAVLEERRRWLKTDHFRYAAITAGAESLLAEFETLATGWVPAFGPEAKPAATLEQRLISLGRKLHPDFALLSKDNAGVFRLRAGVACFPTSWALTEKMGLTLDEIHGVVPGLNASIGAAIEQFLGRLKPGMPYERTNWGLAATPELNMHPQLARPRLTLPFDPRRIWVRIEDQILAALPLTGGILFGIRLRLVPLKEILDDRQLRAGFHRAVTSMPHALSTYKGFDSIRDRLIAASASEA
jgi:dimethylamine monooxygenase subunit A